MRQDCWFGYSPTIREPIHDTRNVRAQIVAMPE